VDLARNALARLAALRLVRRDDAAVRTLPAPMRFSLGKTELHARR
jgi:hypothetical protein